MIVKYNVMHSLCTSGSCHLQKYSDASAGVGCISDGQEEHRALVECEYDQGDGDRLQKE